jgi:hypothetical protein
VSGALQSVEKRTKHWLTDALQSTGVCPDPACCLPALPLSVFVQVNVESPEMRELGQGMQVTHLPWFHLFRSGDLVASFSANVSTVSQLRAEIATNKPCTAPGCSL